MCTGEANKIAVVQQPALFVYWQVYSPARTRWNFWIYHCLSYRL